MREAYLRFKRLKSANVRLIDTDVCSYVIRRNPEALQRFLALNPGEWAISVITQHELLYGVRRLQIGAPLGLAVEKFLSLANVIDFGTRAAEAAAQVRADLAAIGLPIGNLDPLIAGHAISLNATLVTNNTKHFERIDGLKIESWLS